MRCAASSPSHAPEGAADEVRRLLPLPRATRPQEGRPSASASSTSHAPTGRRRRHPDRWQPARDCSSVQAYGSNVDNQLFSSSFALQDGMASVRGGSGSGTVSMAIPLLRYSGEDLPPADSLATSSCLGESGNFNSLDNVCGVNPSQGETFVKVYKSGSPGRSLDITKFSSYYELRSELEHLFGLEGQLEDPVRSGWQLVFVDRKNDILLVGDDPWQEFVNSVWCIKILSPQEVQQMVRNGEGLLSAPGSRMMQGNVCDDYSASHDLQNLTGNIASVPPLDY